MPVDVHTLFVTHPSPLHLATAFVIALFTLGPQTSFIPLILLLATLRLYAIAIVNRPNLIRRSVVASLLLGVASGLANIHGALTGTSSPTAATIALVCLTTVTSAFVFAFVLSDAYLRTRMQTHWTQLMLFPTIWSTAVYIVSDLNALGYLVAWSPVQGIDAYNWVLPVLGPTFIDWLVGAWAVVASEVTSKWIMGPTTYRHNSNGLVHTGQLVEIDSQDLANGSAATPHSRKRRPLLYVCTILVVMVIPSYMTPAFPLPSHSPSTVPLSLACALPTSSSEGRLPNIADFLEETRKLDSTANVILWPEGSVFFETEAEKQYVVDAIKVMPSLAAVGVSFEEYLPANQTTRPGLKRNGFMLVTRDGVKLEYFKRHLVPCEHISLSRRFSHSDSDLRVFSRGILWRGSL